MNYFSHGGKIGDLVYGMHTIKLLGGGTLIPRYSDYFTKEHIKNLTEFLESQEYIKGIIDNGNDIIKLDRWDDFVEVYGVGYNNLAAMQAHGAGIEYYPQNESWLICSNPKRVAEVVVSRSLRYNYPMVKWNVILDKLDDIIFVGLLEEYESFCSKFKYVPYYSTPTFYELFQVIAGCKIFCGNQSSPMALAIGLNVPNIVQEVYPLFPNCKFDRPNITYI